jgi:hypothetical protein
MQSLYEARDGLQANLLRDYLAAHHIQSVVLGEYLSGAAGELPAVNFPVVWLLEDRDLARGRQLLAEFLAPPRAAGDWLCQACGAEVDGGFELCWQCGASRPDEDRD